MNDNSQEEKLGELLVKQWEIYVEMADRVSSRRTDASRFFMSLLTGLLAVIPFVIEQNTPLDVKRTVFVAIGLLGLAICFVWVVNIRSYKQLNSLKFKVVHEIEQRLPFRCFEREWEILHGEQDSSDYLRLSRIEQVVPILLTIPYLILLVYSLLRE